VCQLSLVFTAHGRHLNKLGLANAHYVDCQHWAGCYVKPAAMIVCYRDSLGSFVEPVQLKLVLKTICVPNAKSTHPPLVLLLQRLIIASLYRY